MRYCTAAAYYHYGAYLYNVVRRLVCIKKTIDSKKLCTYDVDILVQYLYVEAFVLRVMVVALL